MQKILFVYYLFISHLSPHSKILGAANLGFTANIGHAHLDVKHISRRSFYHSIFILSLVTPSQHVVNT